MKVTTDLHAARLFIREAGMSFRSWREQFRALTTVSRLMDGTAIAALASEFGYETAGAFTTMFRRVMGKTPSKYLLDSFGESRTINSSAQSRIAS